MRNIQIGITPYQAVELIKWRQVLRKAVEAQNIPGFIYTAKIHEALDNIFASAEKGVMLEATIGNTPIEFVKTIDNAFKQAAK